MFLNANLPNRFMEPRPVVIGMYSTFQYAGDDGTPADRNDRLFLKPWTRIEDGFFLRDFEGERRFPKEPEEQQISPHIHLPVTIAKAVAGHNFSFFEGGQRIYCSAQGTFTDYFKPSKGTIDLVLEVLMRTEKKSI
jgi:hypothetical protein